MRLLTYGEMQDFDVLFISNTVTCLPAGCGWEKAFGIGSASVGEVDSALVIISSALVLCSSYLKVVVASFLFVSLKLSNL